MILVLLLDDGREAPGVSTGMIKAAIFLVALVAALRGGRGLEGSRTASREGDCNACVCVCVRYNVYTYATHTDHQANKQQLQYTKLNNIIHVHSYIDLVHHTCTCSVNRVS